MTARHHCGDVFVHVTHVFVDLIICHLTSRQRSVIIMVYDNIWHLSW